MVRKSSEMVRKWSEMVKKWSKLFRKCLKWLGNGWEIGQEMVSSGQEIARNMKFSGNGQVMV